MEGKTKMTVSKNKDKQPASLVNNESADHIITLASGREILIPSKSSTTISTEDVPNKLDRKIIVKNI